MNAAQQNLCKANARIEDLKEQLRLKEHRERQLFMEKTEMERTVTNSNKAALRMSQNVEELQWRIKNNFDTSVKVLVENQASSTPSSRKKSFFQVSEEMIEATSVTNNIEENHNLINIDAYKICDNDNSHEENSEKEPNNNINYEECDSYDEGLGDISSDGDSPVSPTVKQHNVLFIDETTVCQKEGAFKPKNNNEVITNDYAQSYKSIKSENERRPSRIFFDSSNC